MNAMESRYSPLIKALSETIEKKANHRLSSYGVTASQMHILMALHHSESGVYSLKELEKMFHVAQATIVGIVSRLEAKGLVFRFADCNDRRRKSVKLTSRGMELGSQAEKEIEDIGLWLTSDLDTDEKKEFLRLLQKVYKTII